MHFLASTFYLQYVKAGGKPSCLHYDYSHFSLQRLSVNKLSIFRVHIGLGMEVRSKIHNGIKNSWHHLSKTKNLYWSLNYPHFTAQLPALLYSTNIAFLGEKNMTCYTEMCRYPKTTFMDTHMNKLIFLGAKFAQHVFALPPYSPSLPPFRSLSLAQSFLSSCP